MGGPQPETWGGLGGPLQKMSVDHEGALCSAPSTYSARNCPKIRNFVHFKAILAYFYQFQVKFSQIFHTPHNFCVFAGFYLPVQQDSSPEHHKVLKRCCKKGKNRDPNLLALGINNELCLEYSPFKSECG